LNTVFLTKRIQRLAEYTETRNAQINKRLSRMSDTKAQKLIERSLLEILALNFVSLRQCVQLRNQIAFKGVDLFRQQIPLESEIVSLLASLEELIKNRVASALNMEQLAQQSGIRITSRVLLAALSDRKVRRLLSGSDVAYFKSLQQDNLISVKSFMESFNIIPTSSIGSS